VLGRLSVVAMLLFAVAVLLRIGVVTRQGLWADELFSLALATGHSLEHPAAQADPALGDYLEAPQALPSSAYGRYLDHESPAASPERVLRAVALSDTSPPLYYLLLHAWTRTAGTSDASLRCFSVAWALACFPILWSLARQVGGKAAVLPTVLLFTFSPLCVYYSTEGRMYSLLCFWTVSTMWLTLRLQRRGFRLWLFVLWATVGAAGLLTHYFYLFVGAAACGWLFLHPGKLPRKYVGVGAVLVALWVAPWYVHVPGHLGNWRVTGSWLTMRPGGYQPLLSFLFLPWSYLSIQGVWGMRARLDGINLAVFVALAGLVVCVLRKRVYRTFLSPTRRLVWLWLLAPCVGMAVFDNLRGTYVLAVPRYAIAGMPAAFLLVGLSLSKLRAPLRAAFLVVIVLACGSGVARIYRNDSRVYEPFRQLGELLAEQTRISDLVIVHSIPSGVVGVARYLEQRSGSAQGVGFASWVGQLQQRRVPQDLQSLAAGRRRIILVKIHDVGEGAPEELWLEKNATATGTLMLETARVRYFIPRDGDTFFVSGR
jgi:uncharacterized membrane protein